MNVSLMKDMNKINYILKDIDFISY